MEKNCLINDIISEDDSEDGWTTEDLIQKRKKKLPSKQEIFKLPRSYWYGSNLALRTCPPKKDRKVTLEQNWPFLRTFKTK